MGRNNIAIMDEVDVCAAEVELPFPIAEYQNRLNKIRKSMSEKNIDLLYLSSPESLFYVSGYNAAWFRGNSSTRWFDACATGIAIHVDHDKFILFDVPDEEGIALWSTVSTDTRIFYDIPAGEMYGKSYESVSDEFDFADLIVRDLKAEGWTKGRAAIEMGSYRPNRLISEKMQAALEEAGCIEVVDGTKIVRDVRTIKSPMEIRYIETASRIADIGMEAVLNCLQPGITELDIVAEYTYAMHKAGGENMGIPQMVRSGPEKVWCFHAPASRRILMPGDPVGVDLCGVYNRYHSNQCRYFSVGEPDPKFADKYAKGTKAMQKVKEIIKPHMLVDDFLGQMMQFYKEEGVVGEQYWIGGYELGIAFPPDWVGEFVYDPYLDNEGARFEPGMVVNFETGFGIIDTLVFTEEEAKILGNTTWDLQIVE